MNNPVQVLPVDTHNTQLVANVHPPDWQNPTPAGRYNLVVIGAGSAGLITAAVGAGLGAKVALVEKHLLGGDCLNVGCVPSKAVIRSSRVMGEIREAAARGIRVPDGVEVDFAAVMERMRRIRAGISRNDSAARYQNELGVDVFLGEARFLDSDTVAVGDTHLKFKRAVIATGARAAAPPIPGLAEAGYLTNETVFSLTERPARLAVIGAGPIGCELAQAFQRLGSQVTLFEMAPHVLIREDSDAAQVVQHALERDGVQLVLNCRTTEVESTGAEKIVRYEVDGTPGQVEVDALLVGAGRAPNVDNLGLESVGVEYDAKLGVHVNDYLQTTNPRIYAAGDICLATKFTHAADASAKIVIRNALFFGRQKVSDLVMPWCTYTDPEIAHVGMYEADAERQGIAVDTYTVPLDDVDRALTDGDEGGFVKVHTRQGTGTILGATIVAAHAGELISEFTLAMVGKLGLGTFANVIYPYPTQAEAIKRTANAYMRTRFSPLLQRLFRGWLRVTG